MIVFRRQSVRAALAALATSAAWYAIPAGAQTAPAPAPPATAQAPGQSDDDADQSNDIVVTGTSAARAARNTPLSVTTLDATQLQRTTASSQADILNTVPSIKAEGGGGEVAVNVFVKGLPLGGTYQLTPLQYDGIPVLSAFGLNSSAFDTYYRNDLGIERLEFVRGGVSNLFGSGSVAGLINYISKTGRDQFAGVAQLEWAERGRYRGDLSLSGPLDASAGLYYAISGYYRHDDGPIRTGLPTKGGQVRANLKKDFSDGSGSVTLYGQYINDRVQFYLPFPLDGATRKRLPGNDGETVYSVQTPAVRNLGFATPVGRFQTQIADGVYTNGGQVALAFDKQFADGWGLNGKAKYSQYAHRFGFFLDGDGLANVPQTQAGFLALRGLSSDATFTYADDGSAVPTTALLFANRFQDRIRPNHDTTVELNLTKTFATSALTHNMTLGYFMADAWARDNTVTTAYLGAFNNRPRLVNLTVRNAGAPTVVSNGGLLDAGVGYVNNTAQQSRYAIYLADQIEGDRFVLDFGGRYEWTDGQITRALTSTVVTDTTTPNLSTALRNVVWANGTVLSGKVTTDSWAVSAGALYKITDRFNVYLNANRGYFFPALNSVAINAAGRTQSYQPEIIRQAEGGLKYGGDGRFSGSLSVFYNDLKNRRTVLLVNAPGGGVTEQVTVVSTRAYGLEGVLGIRLFDHLRFDGNVSLIDHKFTALDITPQFIGNKEPRQPDVLYNAGLYYDDGRFDASFATTYTGPNYTDNSNAIELDGYNVFRAIAGYRVPLGSRQSARLSVDAYNLFDSGGITEGSPRQVGQTVGAYFVGRPILPRRVSVKLDLNF